jgi:hypothetical protein
LQNECNIEHSDVQNVYLKSSRSRFATLTANSAKVYRVMKKTISVRRVAVIAAVPLLLSVQVFAQNRGSEDKEFGPVVRAYLGYLQNEQEVVDDRASRREITRAYYRRNSNRIRALREMAIRIAHETGNDYLPELEAVANDELGTLFEHRPNPANLRIGETIDNKFRFLGVVRAPEPFYVFARLDQYEQAEQQKQTKGSRELTPKPASEPKASQPTTRQRRVGGP